jgi:2-iminobutanoate/2-iminopropanoate deaminase
MRHVLAVVWILVAPNALAQTPAPATTSAPAVPSPSFAPPTTQGAATRKQVLVRNTTGASPFSRVVRAGGLVFVAGQLGFKQGSRELVPGGTAAETQAALEAISSNLAQAGLGMEDVVKCDVFLADIADFQAMNEAYVRFFPKDPPVRTTVGVSGLWGNARVEIDCIAVTR